MKLTALKPGVHNPNRVNVFLDDTFAFSLDLTQVVDFHLKLGEELSETTVAKLRHASEYGKLYARTLEWVLSRPRSVQETRDRMLKKRFEKGYAYTDEDIVQVISSLEQKGYLNDAKFAQLYAENRNLRKGISRRRLEQELRQKGVAPDLIAATLEASPRDETSEIRKIIAKKHAKLPPDKLLAYLLRQGFPYDLCKSLIAETESLELPEA